MEFKHISVLLEKSIELLNVCDDGIYVDGTLGGGGHSYSLLSSSKSCRLIGIDQDREAIAAASKRLECFGHRVQIVNNNFSNIKSILDELKVNEIDGAILDLGVSSYQLDNGERGFSYMHDAPLDMRMNRDNPKSAYDVVNSYSCEELTKIFFDYGEEKWSKRIAEFIIDERQKKPIKTTFELVDIIKSAIPKSARMDGGHPGKRIFQAIRIEVNNELGILENTIKDITEALKPKGRLAIITFHSLEDRIVKQTFASLSQGCTCPKSFPVCVCNNTPKAKVITRKPILPDEEETDMNSRAKSAKLRVIEKI